ncbi:MAG: hypothetical protein HY811_05485 [Planctomycetes bacterium]|nr:hypothetical protein [Planctomycetota bacterium]
MTGFKIPEGFVTSEISGGWVITKTSYREVLEKEVIPLVDKSTPISGKGRGGLLSFSTGHPDIKQVVIRPCRRGGTLTGPLLKSSYWGTKRAIRELFINNLAFNKGLAVPEMLGIILKRPRSTSFREHPIDSPDKIGVTAGMGHRMGFFKAFVIMKEISGAIELPEYIESIKTRDKKELSLRKATLFKSVLESLLKFHNAGFSHPDLNMKNLLIATDEKGGLKTWIIDLDRVTYHEKLGLTKRIRNLVRLARSMVKLNIDQIITRTDRLWMLKGYLNAIGENNKRALKETNYFCNSNINYHKFLWKILGK